ncbi:MAG: hypothetical protein ABSF85_16005 [Terriglobales bacterium]
MKKLVLAFVLIAIVPLLTFCQQSPKSTASSGPTKARAHSLCPAPKTDGPGIGAQGMKVVYGHLAKLESFGPPIKFDDLDIKVELGNVSYGAGVSGNYAIPFTGRIGSLKINGKNFTLKSGNLDTGCIDVEGIGPVLVLFENSVTHESAAVVITSEQLKKLK